jgi:hypothetical protein
MFDKFQSTILAIALFIIISSKPLYTLTNSLLPNIETQRYGAPTRVGLIIHAVVFALTFTWLKKLLKR